MYQLTSAATYVSEHDADKRACNCLYVQPSQLSSVHLSICPSLHLSSPVRLSFNCRVFHLMSVSTYVLEHDADKRACNCLYVQPSELSVYPSLLPCPPLSYPVLPCSPLFSSVLPCPSELSVHVLLADL